MNRLAVCAPTDSNFCVSVRCVSRNVTEKRVCRVMLHHMKMM